MNTLDRAASRTFMQRRVLAPTSVSHVVVLLDSSIVNVALNLIPAALGRRSPAPALSSYPE